MSAIRRIAARFLAARPGGDDAATGLWLCYRPDAARFPTDPLEDFAALGPGRSLASVEGEGRVRRLLRAVRLAPPRSQRSLAGREGELAALLNRAAGAPLWLEVAPRMRLRFRAFTEEAVLEVDDVADVLEAEDAFLVYRRAGRLPVRVPRPPVVRHLVECVRSWRVLDVGRGAGTLSFPRC